MSINFNDYISGGYYITFPEKKAECLSKRLPDEILSLSSCICDFFPDSWAIEWANDSIETARAEAASFVTDEEAFLKIQKYVTSNQGNLFGWTRTIFTLEAAKNMKKICSNNNKDIVILGAGLHKKLVDEFIKFAKPEDQIPGFAPNGEGGVLEAIKMNRIIEPGEVLGFEPVSTEIHMGVIDHTWACNELVDDPCEEVGIVPNEKGFIENFEDAMKIVSSINNDKIGAEPGLWLPWLVVKY